MIFLKKYDVIKNIRFGSFKFALEEASKRNLKIIVETGVARGKKKFLFFSKINWKDGMSTLMFSEYVHLVKGHLYTCDINQKNINNAKKFTKRFKDKVTFYLDDSVLFLKNFDKKIDFLFLDSLDGQHPNAAEHQLNEIKNSINRLHNRSLVLLDDKGIKTNLSAKYMVNHGFKIINETNEQLLLSFR
jgi:hypothetical protein